MTQDKSREKSLLFLLSTVARSLEVSTENKGIIREAVASLTIQDSEDKWIISVVLPNRLQKSIVVAKDRFIFYPVKSAARYETNPAILNKNSAQDALLELFGEYGARVPGKKYEPIKKQISEYLPLNLIVLAVFTLLSAYDQNSLAALLILSHLVLSTAKHHFSALKRWLLILIIAAPGIVFSVLFESDSKNIMGILSQLVILLSFDFGIRFQLELRSSLRNVATFLTLIGGLTVALVMIDKVNFSAVMTALISVVSFITLQKKISASLKNVMVLIYLGLLLTLVTLLIVGNPLKLLLLPYFIYVAIYETLFGNNRNPAKLAFGVICLTI